MVDSGDAAGGGGGGRHSSIPLTENDPVSMRVATGYQPVRI
jgi:hypothetical protein